MLDLRGANVLVTGAGQGVGRAIALAAAACNAGTVFVNDVDLDRAATVVDELASAGGSGLEAIADVTDYTAVQKMAAACDQHGGVDVLVNNAGNMGADPIAATGGRFWELPPESWDPWIAVNLYGPLNTTRCVLPGMIRRARGGRLVTIISEAGRVGEPGLEAYSAAKAGAAGLTRSIARATAKYSITANNVSIAATRTPATATGLSDEDRVKRVLSRYVIRRVGEPEDIAGAVMLLASPAASWITGQTYPVNGGFSFNL